MAYFPWNKGIGEERLRNQSPMPFYAPKGYKSPFVDLEMSLNELWKGEKKFLQQFHVKPKTAKDKRSENLLGLEFNPDVPRETNPPA